MENKETALDKPGAGLPFFERMMAKYFVMPREVKKRSWDECGALFDREGSRILELIKNLTPEQLEKKVLIDRLPGIEDSSRFWSVKMTLEHLIVVGNGIGKIVGSLTQEIPPTVDVDIAKVKPKGTKPTAETVTVFKSFEENQIARVNATVKNHESKLRHPHPWFGPMTAKQWFWLMASHQVIHRRQIREIIKGL